MTGFGRLVMKLGDTRTVRVSATWPEDVPELGVTAGDPYDLNGKTVVFEVRRHRGDEEPLLHKTNEPGGGIEIQPPPKGHVCLVGIASGDTEPLKRFATYGYADLEIDVRVADGATGTRWTVASGELRVWL